MSYKSWLRKRHAIKDRVYITIWLKTSDGDTFEKDTQVSKGTSKEFKDKVVRAYVSEFRGVSSFGWKYRK